MILDSLDHARHYHSLGERFAAGLAYLATFDPATEPGRYEILGAEVFASVQHYDTAPSADKKWETHDLHADIQFIASGRERILYAPRAALEVQTPYREEKDVTLYRDPAASTSLLLNPGDFAIFLPHDGHKPGCMAGDRDAVAKVVVKIRL